MNPMRTTYQIGTALAIGLAGYWLGRSHVAEPTLPPPARALSNAGSTPPHPKLGQSPDAGNAADLLSQALLMSHQQDAEYAIMQFLNALPSERYASFAAEMTGMFPQIAAENHGHFMLKEFVRLWARQDVAAALAWARELPKCRDMVVDELAEELAVTDAASAIKLLAGERGGLDYRGASLMGKWARQDLGAARTALEQMTGPQLNQARKEVLGVWAEQDPQGALAFAAHLSAGDKKECQQDVFRHLSQQNPEAALSCFKSLPPEEQSPALDSISLCVQRIFATSTNTNAALATSILEGMPPEAMGRALGAIAQQWSTTDLPAAWSWAQSLSNLSEKNQTLQCMASATHKLTAAETMALANQIPGQEARQQFLMGCLDNPQPDVAKLTAVLHELTAVEVRNILGSRSIVESMSEADPGGAAKFLMDVKLPHYEEAWKLVIARWSASDPAAAFAYVSGLPDVPQKYLETAYRGLAETDPITALAKAQAIQGDDDFRTSTTNNVLYTWFNKDPTSFEQAVQGMTGEMRTTALGCMLGKKISDDPSAAAAQWQSMQLSARPEDVKLSQDHEIASEIGSSWVNKNPTEATQWAAGLPTEEMQVSATQGIATTWAALDSLAASKWITSLPAGSVRDAAAAELANAIHGSDPEAALVWAEQIQRRDQREYQIKSALRSLLEKNPEAGKQAVEASSLPDQMKRNLLDR